MVPFSDIPIWKYSYFCPDIQLRNQNCNIYLWNLFTDNNEGVKNQRTNEYVNTLFVCLVLNDASTIVGH